MKQDEYIKTIVVYDRMVNIGLNDSSQCYFIEFVNSDNELQEVSCGTYETDYESVAKSAIDRRRFLVEEWGEEEVIRMEKEREERINKYRERN